MLAAVGLALLAVVALALLAVVALALLAAVGLALLAAVGLALLAAVGLALLAAVGLALLAAVGLALLAAVGLALLALSDWPCWRLSDWPCWPSFLSVVVAAGVSVLVVLSGARVGPWPLGTGNPTLPARPATPLCTGPGRASAYAAPVKTPMAITPMAATLARDDANSVDFISGSPSSWS